MWNNRMGTARMEKKLDKILLILDKQKQEKTALTVRLLTFNRLLSEQQATLSEKLDKLLDEVGRQKKEQENLYNDFNVLVKSKANELLELGQNMSKRQDVESKQLKQIQADGKKQELGRRQLEDSIKSLSQNQTVKLLEADQSLGKQLSQLLEREGEISVQTEMIQELVRLLVANKYLDDIQDPNKGKPLSKS